jgi:hypothetical protein
MNVSTLDSPLHIATRNPVEEHEFTSHLRREFDRERVINHAWKIQSFNKGFFF